jgi:hypothetical protein
VLGVHWETKANWEIRDITKSVAIEDEITPAIEDETKP